MKNPIPQISATEVEGGEEGEQWDVHEIEEISTKAVQSGTLHIIHLKKDDVGPLHQWKQETQDHRRRT